MIARGLVLSIYILRLSYAFVPFVRLRCLNNRLVHSHVISSTMIQNVEYHLRKLCDDFVHRERVSLLGNTILKYIDAVDKSCQRGLVDMSDEDRLSLLDGTWRLVASSKKLDRSLTFAQLTASKPSCSVDEVDGNLDIVGAYQQINMNEWIFDSLIEFRTDGGVIGALITCGQASAPAADDFSPNRLVFDYSECIVAPRSHYWRWPSSAFSITAETSVQYDDMMVLRKALGVAAGGECLKYPLTHWLPARGWQEVVYMSVDGELRVMRGSDDVVSIFRKEETP